MSEQSVDQGRRQRLLECWLPLAQQVVQDLCSTYTPEELEALIFAAEPELAETDSATTARAVLWLQHLRNRSEQT